MRDFGEFFAVSALVAGLAGAGVAVAVDDSGTALFIENVQTAIFCQNNSAGLISISSTLHTTGSVDSAVVTRSINGAGETQIGVIAPQQFEHQGRDKFASFADTVQLPNGTYTLTYCFTQSGARGREPKQVCGDIQVTVSCGGSTNQCSAGGSFFGDIIGNRRLCNGNGTPTIPVHLKADAVGDVELLIQGPNDFSMSGVMSRAGQSCNYHYDWDTRNGAHGGEGSYTFTAFDDSGEIATVTTNLYCP